MTEREKLPQRRACVTRQFVHNMQRYWMTCSYFEDTRRPAEIFLTAERGGSESEAIARDGAILASLCFQHGVSLDTMRHAVTRDATGGAATAIGQALDFLAVIDLESLNP